jgi:bacteriorhodopsin
MESPQNPIPSVKIATEKTVSTKFDFVKFTFYLTYVLLITTGTITLVEALATKTPFIRHIMNLETCISIIAGYFYSQFVTKVTTASGGVVDYKEINETRYNDWFITTPLMILALMLALSYNNKSSVHVGTYVSAVILNFAMLYSGYLGEKNTISKGAGCLIGFIFFIGLFGLIYLSFVKGSASRFNFILFGIYLAIWGLYGFVYLLDEENKNIAYNILDATAKCFVGLGLWTYFTKILVV